MAKSFTEIEGNLISLAKDSKFDVITHGCNCFCTMGAGIAVEMKKHFDCNNPEVYKLEHKKHIGNVNKLGCIEDHLSNTVVWHKEHLLAHSMLVVINSYTQYYYGSRGYQHGRYGIPLDYDALTLCMRKINAKYPNLRIGLPPIGATHGGGDWNKIKGIIETELKDMHVTIVKLPK